MLPVNLLYDQVVPVQDDLEQKFSAGLVLENLAHERVVHQPEVLNDVKYLSPVFGADVAVFYLVHRNHRPFLEL